MHYPLRPITVDEFAKFVNADTLAFGYSIPEDAIERMTSGIEFDRTIVAEDGEDFVATGAVLSFDMTVPGGSLPAGGVTFISVRPTHRRQGILTSVMARQLGDIRDRGESFAALWASESVIYGRFGYGMATQTSTLSLDRAFKQIDHAPEVSGNCRFVTHQQALTSWPEVYERIRKEIPGTFNRSEHSWATRHFRNAEKQDGKGRFYVQYEEGGRILGFVRYEVESLTVNGSPDGILTVNELQAETHAAYAALWQFILGVDLIKTINAERRRVDESLFHMLAEPRRMSFALHDALWVRIVDVAAALSGRRYSREGRVVIEVHDSFCEWVAGRYALEGGPDGATCKRTTEAADVSMSARDLGAIYMGGTRLQTLAAAGRVEGSRDALNNAAAMFAWDPLPWCPEIF